MKQLNALYLYDVDIGDAGLEGLRDMNLTTLRIGRGFMLDGLKWKHP